MSRFKDFYRKRVFLTLKKELNILNSMDIPNIKKITLNMGIGKSKDKKEISNACEDLTNISGQKAIITRSKKSIAGFKIRAGWPIGTKVTLRGNRMYEFLDRLITIAIPRIRDFRGLSLSSFDGYGNYSMGIKEQTIFPEIDYDKIDRIRGMNITFTTTAKTNLHGKALLKAFNFPLKN
jgi:large subunit ribosomal protein L5